MYKFNDFQYETYAEELIDRIKDRKSDYCKAINKVLLDSGYLNEHAEKLGKTLKAIGMGTAVGDTVSIILSVVNQSSLKNTLLSLLGVTCFGVSESLIAFAISTNKSYKNVNRDVELIYDQIVFTMEDIIAHPEELTDEKIHSITESLHNGEFDFKYDLEGCDEKLEITSVYFTGIDQHLTEPVRDPAALRLYEVMMHMCNMAYEGYEEDVKEGYNILMAYVHDKKHNKDYDRDSYMEVFSRLESKCASMARSRK